MSPMTGSLELSDVAPRLPRGTRGGIGELRALRGSALKAVSSALGGNDMRMVAPGRLRVENLRHQAVFMDLMILMIRLFGFSC